MASSDMVRGSLTGRMPALAGWAGRSARGIRWYMTSLMGDRAYSIYVDHLAVEHPGQPPLAEREFWVQRYREQEATPGARCC
jgi:uncharacterized short protein YbdD (DUF466 family)